MAKKKSKRIVHRLVNSKTGEHYTVRITREAYDKIVEKGGEVSKFSKKDRKHTNFKIKKVKFVN